VEKAFERYRLMSFVTGTTLITLFLFLFLHWIDLTLWNHLKLLVQIDGIGHGLVLYPIYMVLCFQFALKARLHVGFVVLMLLAGWVPGLAFYMEHKMERRLFPSGYSRR
jgi:integral membrane protein